MATTRMCEICGTCKWDVLPMEHTSMIRWVLTAPKATRSDPDWPTIEAEHVDAALTALAADRPYDAQVAA